MVLVGSPGVGKAHMAVALGVEAVRARKLTYFVDCQGLVGDLKRAAEKGALERRMRFYSHLSPLIVDEVGYLDVDKEGADLLFQLVSRRYERRSTIVTTSVGIGARAKVLGDPVVASAIADRLRHHCTVPKITGRSYRTKGLAPDRDAGNGARRRRKRRGCVGAIGAIALVESVKDGLTLTDVATAFLLAAEADDFSRFPTAPSFASWCGLAPLGALERRDGVARRDHPRRQRPRPARAGRGVLARPDVDEAPQEVEARRQVQPPPAGEARRHVRGGQETVRGELRDGARDGLLGVGDSAHGPVAPAAP